METVQATHIARPFHVLITNEGVHPAAKWAKLTAALIVEPRTDAMPDARAEIENLKLKIEQVLIGVFNEVGTASSQREIVVLVFQASGRIAEVAASTKWAEIFAAAPIRAAMEELILRNLASVNEIALRTE